MENKEKFYQYAESLGISVNDAQRLMMLAKENKELPKTCKCGNFEYKPNSYAEDGYCRNCREEVASPKTTDIPTAEEFIREKYKNHFLDLEYLELNVEILIEFTKLKLTKQAEVIAEKAEMRKYKGHYSINKQSILQAGEEYKQSVK